MIMRVLLVDDELELVSALTERLVMRGIDAEYASTGQEAIQRVGNNRYDLVVLDVKMPGIAGLALKKELRNIHPELKFLFMTGYGSDAVIDEIRQDAEGNIYLVKPVEIGELIRSMYQVLPAERKDD
jgi:DNA-binding response OmpR family regulator